MDRTGRLPSQTWRTFLDNHAKDLHFNVTYHPARTHLSLGRDSPNHREIEPPDKGEIVELPVLGGLHHVYSRRAAA